MNCKECNRDMVLVEDDTPLPHSWGGYRLWGCDKCGRVRFERFDLSKKAKKHLKEDKEKSRVKNKVKELKRIIKDKKSHSPKHRPKPLYDPHRHHDNHLIN